MATVATAAVPLVQRRIIDSVILTHRQTIWPLAGLLVVVDDADLPLGQIRLRTSGGSGGHNGLRSIIEALGGNEEFARLRVGIGRSAPAGADITGHVLGRFAPAEREAAEQAIVAAMEAVECCLRDGLTEAMNRFNRKPSAP